jgi:hypothetical protein
MRYFALLLVLALGALGGKGCKHTGPKPEPGEYIEDKTNQEQTANHQAAKHDEPLLLLDDEPLLLLNDGSDTEEQTGPIADNSRCHVCHMNYTFEEIAVTHARAEIGCADCHGDSDAHIADESWSWGENGTAPDIMYRPPEVNEFCMSCHPKDKIDAEQHKTFFAGTAEEKYCTDCHGKHRLASRKCKWK